MFEQRITIDAGSARLHGVKQTRDVLMPHPLDRSRLADAFRRRNKGKTYDVYEFRGIPYADPAESWWDDMVQADLPSGAFDATTYKSIWPTISSPSRATEHGWRPNDGLRRGLAESDKWGVVEKPNLLLDICTPNPTPGADMPVIVNVHGGSNYLNARTYPRFSGRGIARKGVVHVNLTIPLGSWGFFDHPAFEDSFQPNQMYAAILVALGWVQDNIHWFGGRPLVTGTGTSAGGQAWTHLMPMAGDLFHRIQAHSGGDISRRVTREHVRNLGKLFLATLIKSFPATWDPSRTIQQVLDEDGEAAALRLGPTEEQIHQFMGQRGQWSVNGAGALVRSVAGLVNIWPINDGDIIQHQTVQQTIAADRWPTNVQAWFTHVRDEASVFDGMKDATNSNAILRRVNITDPAEIAAIEAMVESPGDHTPRILAGEVVFKLPAYLQAAAFTAKGGTAWNTDFNYDTLGNGRRIPTHASQQVTFTGLPEWQTAQGTTAESLRLTAGDLLATEVCTNALAAYAMTGDPRGDYDAGYDVDLFPASDMAEVGQFDPFGDDSISNVVDNLPADPDRPTIENVRGLNQALYDALSANL